MGDSKIFIICGPSGVGKKTLLSEIVKKEEFNLELNVSYTSRAPREGECEGKDYYFISKKEFEKMIKNDEFLEYAHFFGEYYGTRGSTLEKILKSNKNVILEIEILGFKQLQQQLRSFVSIFIYPLSLTQLEDRLKSRKTESEEQIAERLKKGEKEMSEISNFKYKVLNDSIEKSLKELETIFRKELNLSKTE